MMTNQQLFAFVVSLYPPKNPSLRFPARQVAASGHHFRIPVCPYATLIKNKQSENKPPNATTPPPSVRSSSRLQNFVDNTPVSVQNAILLSVVPCLWGTSGVAAKFLLSQPSPMPLSLINLYSFTFAYISLVITSSLSSTHPAKNPCNQQKTRDTLRSGAELGIYLYIGSMLNLEALSRTSASRAAFFVQLTTVFVPIAGALLGESLQPQVVAACTLALLGAGVLSQNKDSGVETLSGNQFSSSPATSWLGGLNTGDYFAIVTALLYSVHVLRLERIKRREAGPVILVQGKALMQVALSLVAVSLTLAHGDTSVASYMQNFTSMPLVEMAAAVWWCVWIGSVTSALATWAQVVGQQRVGPSRAAIFYATQPVWAAALACAAGLDRLTGMEVVGGGLIVAAGAVVAVVDRRGR